jgi:DNA-binding MarR family transcriptional regulator
MIIKPEVLSELPKNESVPPEVDATARRLLGVIPAMFRYLMSEAREEIPASCEGLGEAQFRLIHMLNYGSLTTGDLAEKMKVRAPTISRTIDHLVDRGLVVRRADAGDRRKVWLDLTPHGKALAHEMEIRICGAMARFLEPLDNEQLATLTAACDTLEGLLTGTYMHAPAERTAHLPGKPLELNTETTAVGVN